MSAEQIELGDDRVLGVMQCDELVALVWKRGAGLGEVPTNLRLAVVDVARGDDLVARVREGSDRRVEVVVVLGLHVLAHDGLAALAQLGGGWGRAEVGHGALLALLRRRVRVDVLLREASRRG